MCGKLEIKFMLLQEVDKSVGRIISGDKPCGGIDATPLERRLFKGQGISVVDFKIGDIGRRLPLGYGVEPRA